MNFYSLNNKTNKASFREAVINGLAPDRGLYFPERTEKIPPEFFEKIEDYSNEEIAHTVIKQFTNKEIPDEELKRIISDTLCFEFPLVAIEKGIYALELFHGPTMAFKDVGGRFMARCLGFFNGEQKTEKVTVLVATSGDTGGAVASGFLGVPGVEVVILYPSGKVSDIQERQLTTLGRNITALEVDGVFDDCQDMVKTAFTDKGLSSLNLTSANSINIARWLPQMLYFFFAYKQLKLMGQEKDLVFSVPSGNFGNICAGMMAYKLGLPVSHFVAATNINDTVPQYLKSGFYEPKSSKPTISNAMDVGNPSNFIRIQELFDNDAVKLKTMLSAFSFNDQKTKEAMLEIYRHSDYIADPHGAVGYLGLKKYLNDMPGKTGVFLETAHPVKFLDVVESTLNTQVGIPEQIRSVLDKPKKSIRIASYDELKAFLLSQ